MHNAVTSMFEPAGCWMSPVVAILRMRAQGMRMECTTQGPSGGGAALGTAGIGRPRGALSGHPIRDTFLSLASPSDLGRSRKPFGLWD